MRTVLIATTNKDKFRVVANIFKKTLFPEDKYEIICQTDDMNIHEEWEIGNNIARARTKAINAFNSLKKYNYDYIVGLDDALVVKGRVEPNVKMYVEKILYENYLAEGEEYAFNRAYCIVDKNKKIYEISIDIPVIYYSLKEDIVLEDHTYPLSNVSYPIGYNKPLAKLSPEEETNYYLHYVKDGLMRLGIPE